MWWQLAAGVCGWGPSKATIVLHPPHVWETFHWVHAEQSCKKHVSCKTDSLNMFQRRPYFPSRCSGRQDHIHGFLTSKNKRSGASYSSSKQWISSLHTPVQLEMAVSRQSTRQYVFLMVGEHGPPISELTNELENYPSLMSTNRGQFQTQIELHIFKLKPFLDIISWFELSYFSQVDWWFLRSINMLIFE